MNALRWVRASRASHAAGDFLDAYELAMTGLEQYPDDPELRYHAVLALVRAGALESARKAFDDFGLASDETLRVQALRARMLKEEALRSGPRSDASARASARLYEALFRRSSDPYPAVNAASMSLWAGDVKQAEALAREVLSFARGHVDDYYSAVTRAEALLVLSREEEASALVEQAAELHGGDHARVATSLRQLTWVCARRGVDPRLLEPLQPPAVVHYTGHLTSTRHGAGRFPPENEAWVTERVERALEAHRVGFGYGALACGADILVAEALLRRGAELRVVLPCSVERFRKISVAPGGASWLSRFDRCLDAASSLDGELQNEVTSDAVFFFASRVAMGTAVLRAQRLFAKALQLAVIAVPSEGPVVEPSHLREASSSEAALGAWRARELPAVVVDARAQRPTFVLDGDVEGGVPDRSSAGSELDEAEREGGSGSRQTLRALLFADIEGYSTIPDDVLPKFYPVLMARFAEVLDAFESAIDHANTWGDALYVVFDSAPAAACCALQLRDAMNEATASPAAVRIAVHFGPVYAGFDPVLKKTSFYGAHVTRTARIEPVTPSGQVYVTHTFAAELALQAPSTFRCDYVGNMKLAKAYGRFPTFLLLRSTG